MTCCAAGTAGRELNVRDAQSRDAEACVSIYAPYVTDTAISFECDAPSPAEMAQRIAAAVRTHAWVCLRAKDASWAYAYGRPFVSRTAYRWSCEVSVYMDGGRRRTGGGRALYEALFDRLARRGFRTAVAGMTLPNEASAGLHRVTGFTQVGTYRRIGWKHGRRHDVAWVQRTLTADPDIQDAPAERR